MSPKTVMKEDTFRRGVATDRTATSVVKSWTPLYTENGCCFNGGGYLGTPSEPIETVTVLAYSSQTAVTCFVDEMGR